MFAITRDITTSKRLNKSFNLNPKKSMKTYSLWFTGDNGGIVIVDVNSEGIIVDATFTSKNLVDDIEPATIGQSYSEYLRQMETLAGLLHVEVVVNAYDDDEEDEEDEPFTEEEIQRQIEKENAEDFDAESKWEDEIAAVWEREEKEEAPYGFFYLDEKGNRCWTEDFETSIGE